MLEHEEMNLERDPRFPSGAWTGFFLQLWRPGRHKTDLSLTCRDGDLTGTGRDLVGPFSIQGRYDLDTGECEWIKRYLGQHTVTYRGHNDGHGIWGVWEIKQLGGLYIDRGGFHIWPEGTDISEETDQTEQAVLAVMRKEYGKGPSMTFLLLLILGLGVAIGLALLLQEYWGYGPL
jgi:hypothetical protein